MSLRNFLLVDLAAGLTAYQPAVEAVDLAGIGEPERLLLAFYFVKHARSASVEDVAGFPWSDSNHAALVDFCTFVGLTLDPGNGIACLAKLRAVRGFRSLAHRGLALIFWARGEDVRAARHLCCGQPDLPLLRSATDGFVGAGPDPRARNRPISPNDHIRVAPGDSQSIHLY